MLGFLDKLEDKTLEELDEFEDEEDERILLEYKYEMKYSFVKIKIYECVDLF